MLLLHYHIFKNAGTSLDVMLQQNFGAGWAEGEFPTSGPGGLSNPAMVEGFLRSRGDLKAFSSHTAQLPLPKIDREVFPIFFIRHPLDRLKSAYDFERVQVADTHGARLAKQHGFAGYTRELLAKKNLRQARNFQTERLAGLDSMSQTSELERAMRTLDSIPFVGLVEAYRTSVERLGALLAPHFEGFRPFVVHENRTAYRAATLQQRLATIEVALPSELLDELNASNADDFALYERVKASYA